MNAVEDKNNTNIAPSTNHVQKIISAKRQIDDALVDSLAASFRCQIFLGDLGPSQRTHGESDRLVFAFGICSSRIASPPKHKESTMKITARSGDTEEYKNSR